MPLLQGVSFSPDYGFVTVQPGQQATILEIHVPDGMVAFIEEVATNWPSGNSQTYQEWFIDGASQQKVYTPIGENFGLFPVGALPTPRKFNPPIVAKSNIKFIGVNNNATAQVFETICRGTFYEKPL